MLLMEQPRVGGGGVNERIILQDQLCVGGYVEEQLARPLCGSAALFHISVSG